MNTPPSTTEVVACRAFDLRHAPLDAHPRMVGYARVFARGHALDDEIAVLQAVGCVDIHCDDLRGAAVLRPGLDDALAALQPGDCLTVISFDRLTWRFDCLLPLLADIGERGGHLRSLMDGFDTQSTPNPFGIFRCLEAYAGSVMAARSAEAGLSDPRHKVTASDIARVREQMDKGSLSVNEAARSLGINRSTLYRRLDAAA